MLTKIAVAVLTLGLLPLAQQELYGWCFSLAEWVLRRAAHSLPEDVQERYEAEWLGDLDMLRGRNLYALYWSIRTVMHEPALRRAVESRVRFEQAAKRALDLIAAAFALLILAPALGIIALAVKLASPGPVFERDERVGRHGRRYMALLYRTSVSYSGPNRRRWQRAMLVSRFLRRTTLNGLPQFVNVLRGEMSLVGPRAPDPHELLALHPNEWDRRLKGWSARSS